MSKLIHDGRELKLVTVEPALAELWLATANTKNRPLDQSRVDEYARAMLTGQWRLSNDALSFDKNGVLLNGQHRLRAVAKSRTTQVFAVLEGAEPEDQNVMDVGKGRKAGQQLHIQGWRNSGAAAAIVRALLRWGDNGFQVRFRPTIAEISEYANRNSSRLEVATDTAMRVCRTVPLSRALVGAVCSRAYDLAVDKPTDLPVAHVEAFFTMVETGANMPANHPIMVLRARAIRHRVESIRWADEEQLYAIIRTWNADRKGERYTKLQLPVTINPDHLKLK
jgi:hypothetical protein